MKPKYIPNCLSVIRILLVPLFIYLFLVEKYYGALAVFLIGGATDVLDGFLARHFGWITDIGKILDPIGDKLMQCAALACLYAKGIIPLWLLIFFAAKESLMLIGGLFVFMKKKFVVVSSWQGKLAVVFFYAAIVFFIVAHITGLEVPMPAQLAICIVMLGLALFAILKYFTDTFLKRSAPQPDEPEQTDLGDH